MVDTIIPSQPASYDMLNGLNFQFQLTRLPSTSFFVTGCNIPGLSLNNPSIPTPFKVMPLPADKVNFNDFRITFKVDAAMGNWIEIFNWMIQIGFPKSFDQRAAAEPKSINDLYSDASLIIMDYHRQPIVSLEFKDILPSTLTDVEFDVTIQNVDYAQATVGFTYQNYEILSLLRNTQQ